MARNLTALIVLTLLPLGLVAEITVSARFNPPRIALGDRAQYIVEIRETSDQQKPEVERVTSLPMRDTGGLDLRNGRTSSSRQTRVINGAAEYSVTQSLIIDASASTTGSYTIPAFTFDYKGKQRQAPSATLRVVERPADAPPPRDELIFLQTDLPEQLYVGQKTPVELKLYIAEQVRLTGLNRFERSADGFTVSPLPEEPRESTEMLEGRRYRVLTWPLTLAPIQTGMQNIRFEFGLTARLPTEGSRRNRGALGQSPFGKSFFDDFFGRNERLNLYTDLVEIDVQPLPERGQPEHFSGAIGDFAMEVGHDSDQARQGEPVMLSVVLRGRGNFDRIEGPTFTDDNNWRFYEPEANFEADGALGIRGSKRFDYVCIPRSSGKLELPTTQFSYFDPDQGEYVTLSAPAIPVNVAAGTTHAAPTTPASTTAGAGANESELKRELSTREALLTLDYQPKPPRPTAFLPVSGTAFLLIHLSAAAALAAFGLRLQASKRRRHDPDLRFRQAARRGARKATKAAREAIRSGDRERFFREAQAALRQKLGARSGQPLHTAGADEMAEVMRTCGIPPETITDCCQLFTTADASRFGRLDSIELTTPAQQFESVLKAL